MRILLVDANHLAGRCGAVMKDLHTTDGQPSGVVHGVIKGLFFIKNELKIHQSNIICCWDGGRAARRMELHPTYKSGRKWSLELTEAEQLEKQAYYAQLTALQVGLSYFGVRQVRVQGVEADDLIGIFSKQYDLATDHTIIYSGDHDMHQLVSDNVHIYEPTKKLQTKADILARWGARNITDIMMMKALQGDSTDAVPGIPRFGEKTAQKVAVWFGSGKPEPKEFAAVVANYGTVHRNLQLLRIPRTWQEFPYYSDAQKSDAMSQLEKVPQFSIQDVLAFADSWDLNDTKEQLHRW